MKALSIALAALLIPLAALAETGITLHLSPTGNDANPGTRDKPLATLAAAQRAARAYVGREPVTISLHAGIYYLPETLRITVADSGTKQNPVEYSAAPGEQPVISGGAPLRLDWKPGQNGVFQAPMPAGQQMDQLFVNDQHQQMARYPNYDRDAPVYNGTAADAIAPERVARWSNPAGGYIHAMHKALWGDMHWRILGKKADGSLDYEGGWQNNRPSAMHPQFRFVENLREELDAPGEWFHDSKSGMLFFQPPVGVDLKTSKVEAAGLSHLIEFNGTRDQPVKFITLRGLKFMHTARTFMENREPLLRSDWTTYRGGAVMFTGTEDATVEDCDFEQLGGNSIFINNYNRRTTVRGCLIREGGANGVAFVGDPKAVRSPRFSYGEKSDYKTMDMTPGPLTPDFPADCLVEDCLITRIGRFEKQTAGVEISMAQRITVRSCSIHDVPRAGINIGDGCWGGHVIENCDVFDTVMETGDHGSFNSWGRDRYWNSGLSSSTFVAENPDAPFLDVVEPVVLRNSRWRCDHGWDIDLDDGSSHYIIQNNLLLNGGLKLREGYGRVATNNIIVNNSLHPHVWQTNSGDVFARNIVMGAYRPALMKIEKWGKEVDKNLFTTSEADRTKFADKGCDANSLVGDPLFVDPAHGDFRVKDGSPAIKLGFVNFPMDQFGVRSPRLKAIAGLPEISPLRTGGGKPSPRAAEIVWQGAKLRALVDQEFSSVGVAADAVGVLVADVPERSAAHVSGLRQGDFIQQVNHQVVRSTKQLLVILETAPKGRTLEFDIVRSQKPQTLTIHLETKP